MARRIPGTRRMWRHTKGGASLSITVVFVVIYLSRLLGIENLLLTDLFAVLGLAAITIFYLILDLRYDSGLRSTSK